MGLRTTTIGRVGERHRDAAAWCGWSAVAVIAVLGAQALLAHDVSGALAMLGLSSPLAAGVLVVLLVRERRARAARAAEREELDALIHDLRGPLLTARNYLDLIEGEAAGLLPDDAVAGVHRAALATARAHAVASAMAALGRDDCRAVAVPLGELLQEVVGSLSAEIARSGATIRLETLPTVHGDPEALRRIFANLIENAVKYAREDRAPSIEVLAHREGVRWVIEVRDLGIGIPLAERGAVFEARTRGSNTQQQPGTGLGLATVRRLARAQRGDAWVVDDVAEGTCIHVTLPE